LHHDLVGRAVHRPALGRQGAGAPGAWPCAERPHQSAHAGAGRRHLDRRRDPLGRLLLLGAYRRALAAPAGILKLRWAATPIATSRRAILGTVPITIGNTAFRSMTRRRSSSA